MSIIGMVLMWAFAFLIFIIITRWPMGKVSDEREAFWSKYLGK